MYKLEITFNKVSLIATKHWHAWYCESLLLYVSRRETVSQPALPNQEFQQSLCCNHPKLGQLPLMQHHDSRALLDLLCT